MTGDGQVALQLRHRWIDGTTHLVFDPVEFLGRLAVLVPRPRINLIRYPRVLGRVRRGDRKGFRRESSEPGRDVGLNEAASAHACETDTPHAARRSTRGESRAALMQHTFGFDVLACPRCGGRRRLIALIEEVAVLDRIIRHLSLPTETPAPRPARAPPLLAGVPDAAGWDERCLGVRRVFLSGGGPHVGAPEVCAVARRRTRAKAFALGDSTAVILDLETLRQVDVQPDSEVEISVEDSAIVTRPRRSADDDAARAAARTVISESWARGLVLEEIASDTTIEEVRAATGAELIVDGTLGSF